MTDTVSRLRELLAKGTPRPWRIGLEGDNARWPESSVWSTEDNCVGECYRNASEQDAALIIAAVNALPKLLNDIEKARSLVALHEEYEQFLNEANEGPLSLASIHGWRCPEAEFQRGLDYRQQIAALRAALRSASRD